VVTESDGYLFIPMYGPRTDWVKHVLVAQAARLRIDGHEIELKPPRLMRNKDVWPMLRAPCHVRGSGVDRFGVPGLQCASRLVR